ncbi:MAG TPA: tetratricopeptide repeat protein [Chthoniobacterales bacterium]
MKGPRPAQLALFSCVGYVLLAAGLGDLSAVPLQKPGTPSEKATPKVRVRGAEGLFYSDQRPAAPDQQLQPALERKAQAEAFFIEGLVAEDDGDFEAALQAYTSSLQLDAGSNPSLTVRVAQEYAKRGDVATGIDLLKDLVKARPDEVSAYLALASLYFKDLNKPDLAVRYAEGAVRTAPDNVAGYQTLFDIYVALKRRREAEQMLAQAQRVDSSNPNFWLSLVDLAIRLYRPEGGTFPTDKLSTVLASLQKAVSLAHEDAPAVTHAADDYVALGQVTSAIPLYLRALELNRGSGEVRYKLAESFLKTGKRDEAIAALEELIKTNPLKPEIYEFLARLYEESGDRERALGNYQQALLLAPNDPENYLRAAEMQLQLRKNDEAIALLTDARRRFSIPQVTYALAVALSQAKRFDEALPVFESALQESNPDGRDSFDAGFYFNYAVAAEQAGLTDKAAALLKKTIEIDPSQAAQAYNYLGYMWVDKGQHLDEAGEMIRKALQLEPNNGAYLDSFGWYFYKKGEYGKALTELLHAAEVIRPEDAVVYEHVGDAYQALGNVPQALTLWQKALTLDPHNQGIAAKVEQARTKLAASSTPTPAPPVTP